MSLFAIVVTPGAHSVLAGLLVISSELFILLCFIRVAAYATRKIRAGRLIPSENAPVRFTAPGLSGWLFAASVLVLILIQDADSAAGRHGSAGLFYYFLVPVGVSVLLLYNQRTAQEQFGLGRISVCKLLKWSLLICGATIFIEVPLTQVIDGAMNLIHLPHPEQESVEFFRQNNNLSVALAFVVQAVFLSPLIEELFFRGFLFGFLKNYTSTWVALILSAGVFAFVHANLGSVLQLWLLGIVLGIAYEHTGSLLLPIGIHACWNLVTALSLLLDKGTGTS